MSLLGRLALLFVAVPLVELALLIEIGRWVGAWPTVALVALTGASGAWLARAEGLRVLFRVQEELARGHLPGEALLDGMCVLVGGAFLLTPGVLTDAVGFALLLPPARRGIQAWLRKRLERALREGTIRVATVRGGAWWGGTTEVERNRGGELDPSHGIDVGGDEDVDGVDPRR